MRILAILLEKEFRQIFRNSFMPKLIIVFPIMVMLVIPLVTTMDVRHVGVAVVDADRSPLSQRMLSHLEASGWFTVYGDVPGYAAALQLLEQGEVDVIVEIPRHFERDMVLASPRPVSVSANSVNASKGALGMQYVLQVISRTLRDAQAEKGSGAAISDFFAVQYRYNEILDYRHYMIPALMIMLLIMLCCFLPTLNIVSEKERGTIEQMNVTPLNRMTFTLGKLIPYWIIGLFALSVAMLLARLVYGLSPVGSLGAIYLAAGLFVLAMSGFGVVLANRSETMQQAMFVMFFFVMLFVLMSGLMTPVESMPDWAQKITVVFPPRYFVGVMRSVYLKGTSVSELHADYIALAVFAVAFNLLAAVTYKKQS
ncbi:MAG: ABC transporter permease [Coprobacter sp.]|nr:ABC transporter permease [Coprobacter sp.]